MSDLLAPVGTRLLYPDGRLYGVVDRASASSVWTSGRRLVAAFDYSSGQPGGLKRHGLNRQFPDCYIEGSPAHVARERQQVEERERAVADRVIHDCRTRVTLAYNAAVVGSGLSHAERAALAQRLADEVLAILEAPRD